MPHRHLVKEFQDVAHSVDDATLLMHNMSQRIHMHIPRYNWVGFYLVDPTDHRVLLLGPHTGSFTPKPTIFVHRGLSGAAFSNWQVIVADNVAEDARYVCSSDLVKSHISVPLLVGNRPMGVFSIESYFLATFKPTVEREFVETCARIVGTCAERIGSVRVRENVSRLTAPISVNTNPYRDQRRRTPTGV